jgi:enoyl-CoA hydratase/carnithine racemase
MSNMRDAVGLCLEYSKPDSPYETQFEPALNTVWTYLNPKGRPCYSLELLKAMVAHDKQLAANGGRVEVEGELQKVDYYVTASRTPGVFNLGGDLALFVLLIKTGDREALSQYAKLCIDVQHPRIHSFFSPTLTSIALVQGDALGGGFECALASDVIIAEESAQLGFPEILFNLFPGMGAYSLLERRVGMRVAEELILSSKRARHQLYEMGIVDVLAPTARRAPCAAGSRPTPSAETCRQCSRGGTCARSRARARQRRRAVGRRGAAERARAEMMSRLARPAAMKRARPRPRGRGGGPSPAGRGGAIRAESSARQALPQGHADRAPEEAEMADAPHLRIGRRVPRVEQKSSGKCESSLSPSHGSKGVVADRMAIAGHCRAAQCSRSRSLRSPAGSAPFNRSPVRRRSGCRRSAHSSAIPAGRSSPSPSRSAGK